MTRPGLFIAIEGSDGSGKATQTEQLCQRLIKAGYEVSSLSFPRYKSPSSFFLKKYLQGGYGQADEVDPYTASILFALDRYDIKRQLLTALDQGRVVVADRFLGSNLAHQGTKFDDPKLRQEFFLWEEAFETQTLGIPAPDINLVLRLPAATSARLRRQQNKDPDLHEKSRRHQELSRQVYDQLCQVFPDKFIPLDCANGPKLLSVKQVGELIWQALKDRLPKPGSSGRLVELEDRPALVASSQSGLKMTPAGQSFLQPLVTDTKQSVYAFTGQLSPVTIAAAMARLSRRGDDMRITLLDEFADQTQARDQGLLERVITAYGDDSVQQLVGQHLVVEGASNLLTKKLEWGRLAAYLEQSTRYIYFDQLDANGRFKYLVPPELKAPQRATFGKQMDQIFKLYSDLVRQLTDYVRSKDPPAEPDVAWRNATRAQACDAARAILPVATKSTVGIFASGQALEALIMRLRGDPLLEARSVGQAILDQARQVMGVFLQRADQPEKGGAQTAYQISRQQQLGQLAAKLRSKRPKTEPANARLIGWSPLNELDLVPDMLYEHSQLSHSDLVRQVSRWSYRRKRQVFEAYIGERLNRRQRPGRALEKAHYSWDIVCDYGIFRDLQRHRMVDDLTWQKLTPDYGYTVPNLVEKAGLADHYHQAFEISTQAYRQLLKAHGPEVAQYATLLGHRMRWKVTYNAREAFHLHELRTSPQGHPGYRQLVLAMHSQLTEVHPLLAQAMRFVNQGEDPELTRLAAERYTQVKLSYLKEN